MNQKKYKTVEEYLSDLPANTRIILEGLRKTIKQVVPKAEEVISYNMPAFKQGAVLVYYAANKAHTGFYPTPGPLKAFAEELSVYKSSKGAVHFPYDKKIPTTIVKKMVQYRLQEVEAKVTKKK